MPAPDLTWRKRATDYGPASKTLTLVFVVSNQSNRSIYLVRNNFDFSSEQQSHVDFRQTRRELFLDLSLPVRRYPVADDLGRLSAFMTEFPARSEREVTCRFQFPIWVSTQYSSLDISKVEAPSGNVAVRIRYGFGYERLSAFVERLDRDLFVNDARFYARVLEEWQETHETDEIVVAFGN